MARKAGNPLWRARAFRPSDVDLHPTSIGMKKRNDIPPFIFDNSPFLSAFFISFAVMIPEGERIMVNAVRQFREEVREHHPALYQECKVFCGQEAHHAKETMLLNESLASVGMPIDEMYAFADRIAARVKKLPMIDQMAFTGGAEIFTALLGDMILANPEIMDGLHPYARINLTWHLMEEIAHKSVTHDLLEAVDGTQWKRVYGYGIAVSSAALVGAACTYIMYRKYPREFTVRDTARGLWWMFGLGKNAGHLRRIIPRSIKSLGPNFHPWSEDNSHLVRNAMLQLEKMLAQEGTRGEASSVKYSELKVLA